MKSFKEVLTWTKDQCLKRTVFSWILVASFILGWVAFIIYCVNATTGYLAGRSVGTAIVLLTLLALVCEGALIVIGDRFKPYRDLLFIAAGAFLIISICIYIYERVEMAADVWFIPVNYPESEETTLMMGIVGVAFYALTLLTLIGASVGKNLIKEDAVTIRSEQAR